MGILSSADADADTWHLVSKTMQQQQLANEDRDAPAGEIHNVFIQRRQENVNKEVLYLHPDIKIQMSNQDSWL